MTTTPRQPFDDGTGQPAFIYIDPTTRDLMCQPYQGNPFSIGSVASVEGIVKASGGAVSAAAAADILAALGTDPLSITIQFATGTELPASSTPGEVFVKSNEPRGRKFYVDPDGLGYERVGGNRGYYTTDVSCNVDFNKMDSVYMVDAAATLSIEEDCIDVGMQLEVVTTGAFSATIKSLKSDDIFIMLDGSTESSGIVTASGKNKSVLIERRSATEWFVVRENGTVTGAAVGCVIYDSYVSTTNDMGVAAYGTYRAYVGTVITPNVSIDICQIAFPCQGIAAGGDISAIDFYCQIRSLSGTALSTILGVSAEVDGSDISEGSWVNFLFASPVTVSGPYAVVIKAVAEGGGPDGTAIASGTNFWQAGYTVGTSLGYMTGGLIATGGRRYWNISLASNMTDLTDDLTIRIYGAAS